MIQVTEWCPKSDDLSFAVKQIEKYGKKAFLRREILEGKETGRIAVFREGVLSRASEW